MNIDSNISSRINLMRIVLISGIVFVHIPFDPSTSPYNGTYGLFDWLRVFLAEAVFRIGVPCLSAISGYLLFRAGRESFNYLKTVRSKALTVLLPFLLWNGALFLFALLILRLGIGDGYLPNPWHASTREILTQLFALEGFPINIPLYFLRDLFACILISPLLAWLVHRFPIATLTVLFILAIIPELNLYIVEKRSILFSFSFGIYASLYRIDVKALDRHASLGIGLLIAASAMLATIFYMTGPALPGWVQLLRNILAITGAVGFWLLSAPLIRTSLGQRLSRTGSLSFWIFCAHYPVLVFLWMVWGKTGISFYPLFYCLSLVVLFPTMIISNGLARNYAPSLYDILTGSRSKRASSRASTERAILQNHATSGSEG